MLVSYERTGGFAGIREALTVRRSGSATLVKLRGSGGATFRLSCTRLRALRDALERARFRTLRTLYAPDDTISDGYVDAVTYRGRTVEVLTGATPPPRLARVLRLLREIVGSHR